jgi:hypothetical protein
MVPPTSKTTIFGFGWLIAQRNDPLDVSPLVLVTWYVVPPCPPTVG